MSPLHDTSPLLDPFTGAVVAIDVGMVPVIRAVWELGIETTECCEGWPAGLGLPAGRGLAVICFPFAGRTDRFGIPRGRYRGTKQGAMRLARHVAAAAPDGRWRSWSWQLEPEHRASALLLPNEDLGYLEAQLERAVLAAAGQLTLGGAA